MTYARFHLQALPLSAAEHASSPDIAELARGMEQGQAAEIELMQSMLAARGLPPEAGHGQAHGGHTPAPAASGHSGHG